MSANAAPSTRKARTKTSEKASAGRAAKHSKAVVEESTEAPSVAAPVIGSVEPASGAAAAAAVATEPAETPVAPSVPVVDIAETTIEETAPAPTQASRTVSHEEIAKLAYCYWADRGFQGGSPEEDWLRAEQTLLASL